jgi:HD-GYP domain-containing protein (c-di-GMP phosphodiesterase class II)/pSer/pThr/pTyr-binding forkhead associated (FHA) protein
MKQTMKLRGISGAVKGKTWQNDTLLRAGRLASLEIVLDDSSVSRKHAEVKLVNDTEWVVKDFESTNGTYVNGQRVPAGGEKPLRPRDVVQFGKVAMVVEMSEVTLEGPPSDQLVVAAKIAMHGQSSPNRPLFDRDNMPRAGDQLLALVRAGHHLVHLQSEDALLDSILHDSVGVLDAQRGAIVLAEGEGNDAKLRLRSIAVGGREPSSRFAFSKKLAMKAFAQGESILFKNLAEDEEFRSTQSVADGAMGSALCVMLRTPRKKLGVLHLDRSVFQSSFNEFDLTLADALAAHVSAGIECAQLLRTQKELFQKTIMMLANAVELRDEYTYGHTQRVTRYATMLGERLELPDDQLELIRIGTPLHDIGKIGIPDAILRKPGRLTAAEYAMMQTHTTLGAEYLGGTPSLAPILPIVRSHHERWDGTGYPDRLAGEETPLIARIVAVCDAFDAMTSNRPYHENKKGKPPQAAFDEVQKQAGRQFDPLAVKAFLAIREQVVRVLAESVSDVPLAMTTLEEDGPPTFDSVDETIEPRQNNFDGSEFGMESFSDSHFLEAKA